MPPVAIVKVGSTSTTLLIADQLAHPHVRQQQLINLYDPEAEEILLNVARQWRGLAEARGAAPLAAGGEALRQNSGLEHALRQVFSSWWHLSGSQEGRLAWMAVKAADSGVDAVIDIGGGSTEIITQDRVWSVPFGAARGGDADWPRLDHVHHPVFIGGTALALARIRGAWRLTGDDVAAMRESLIRHPEMFQHLDPLRRQILPTGLALMDAILQRNQWSAFGVSDRGLTEGLWLAASLGRAVRL